jgi:serine/threonine kinase 32
MSKEECIKSGTLRNVFRERVILQDLEHPHILSLRYAFQDEEHLFFVLDWAKGGDLAFNLKRIGMYPVETLRVYAAELSSALNYLHSQSVIHRDIKPENLLLDSRGHVYITDFNCSVSTKERIPNSKAGTLEYMAPEMFSASSYTYSVDWWSAGAVLYQLAYGSSPFKEKTAEATQDSILRKELDFPSKDSPDFVHFLSGLLTRDLNQRLGCSNDNHGFASQIKNHPLFEGMNWDNLLAIEVGYTPFPNCNYDSTVMINELNHSGDKLSQRVRSAKKKNSGWIVSRVSTCFSGRSMKNDLAGSDVNLSEIGTKPREVIEMELMEKYFVPFDHRNKADNPPAVMPPSLVSKRKPEMLQKKPSFNSKEYPQVSIPIARKLTEKSSPLRNGAPTDMSPKLDRRTRSTRADDPGPQF